MFNHRYLAVTIALLCAAGCGMPEYVPDSREMAVGNPTFAPIGYLDFCRRQPEECRQSDSKTDKVKLTKQRWRQLNIVNLNVNLDVAPQTDAELYKTPEYWTYPETSGDCEDYVLQKRKDLIAMGWPPSALLITVALEANGDAHALLIAATDRGDYVLDNQTYDILPWQQTPYIWEKRQSAENPVSWVSLRPVQSAGLETAVSP